MSHSIIENMFVIQPDALSEDIFGEGSTLYRDAYWLVDNESGGLIFYYSEKESRFIPQCNKQSSVLYFIRSQLKESFRKDKFPFGVDIDFFPAVYLPADKNVWSWKQLVNQA